MHCLLPFSPLFQQHSQTEDCVGDSPSWHEPKFLLSDRHLLPYPCFYYPLPQFHSVAHQFDPSGNFYIPAIPHSPVIPSNDINNQKLVISTQNFAVMQGFCNFQIR